MFKPLKPFIKENIHQNPTEYQWEEITINSIVIKLSKLINAFQKLSGYSQIEYKEVGLVTWFHQQSGNYVLDEKDNQYLQFATKLIWICYYDGEDTLNTYIKGDSNINNFDEINDADGSTNSNYIILNGNKENFLGVNNFISEDMLEKLGSKIKWTSV